MANISNDYTVDLESVRVVAQRRFSDMEYLRGNLSMTIVRDGMLDQMAMELKTYVLKASVPQEVEITVSYEVPVIPENLIKLFPSLGNMPTETRTETRTVKLDKDILFPYAKGIPNVPFTGGDKYKVRREMLDSWDRNG